MGNAAQILGQGILCIAFSKMVGSPLTSAYRLRDCLPHLTWKDLKSELSKQYSTIPFIIHATQSFAYLQQCSDELFEMYLHCASEIYHMTDMSEIPAEGLNHCTMLYGLNSYKLKDRVAGHQSAYWNIMVDYFSNTHTFGAGYKKAKGYSRADLDAQLAPVINKIKSTKDQDHASNAVDHISRIDA